MTNSEEFKTGYKEAINDVKDIVERRIRWVAGRGADPTQLKHVKADVESLLDEI
jgi:hypothetical protein